ncbi:DUF2484 family protein [uncultured Tateyamaria sp.]|uniref:DUF2484 family protein n=1 Tax=Tateyamaria sp. TaxID=1929288 RepID=UPI00260E5090|nr:DUF2484 family protein [uncultured Tateyamaria sp.]
MSTSLILACIWGLMANLIAMLPSRDNHWTYAYVLIAIGIPIVGFVTYQHGPGAGIFVMGAGMSVLRWPVIYLSKRIKYWVESRK